jgi:glucose/arabinose dehydrogenase
MALHPNFDNQPYVYLAYTYLSGSSVMERIVRYEYNGSQLMDELILLDLIPGNTTHDGCRLLITPDLKLLVTTGDAQNQPAAQNINSLSGKILRINLDGTIPEDNPWEDNPVFSYGHRNAQGLDLAPNGILYSSEHGPSTDDEFNIIEAGQNYGWPNVHGFCDQPGELTFCSENNVVEPLTAWTPTIATSDIIYYDHPAIPEWNGRVLLTSLKNKRLYALGLDDAGMEVVDEDQYFFDLWGRLRDICMCPDGSVFLATNGENWGNNDPFTHRIIKVWNPDYVASTEMYASNFSRIIIYPNPVKDKLYISIDLKHTEQQLLILSGTGQVVANQVLDSTFTVFQTNNWKNGIYLMVIGNPEHPVFSGKIMVLKD